MKNADGSTRTAWRIRSLVTAIILFAVILLYPIPVQAEKIFRASIIPAGQVIENDVFLTGQQPVIDGTVNGDVFIVGSEATISGEVTGSVFVVAENLNLMGQVNGSLYVVTVELTQPSGGQIGRSMYALTLSLITDPGSSIGRDLNTVAMSARMQGQTERNTAAIIGPWELLKLLWNSIDQNLIGFAPGRTALAKSNAEPVSFRNGSPKRALLRTTQNTGRSPLADWFFATVKSFLKFLIVGGLILWAFPRQFKGWVEKVRKESLASAGYGTIVLINGYLLPVLILFLLVGLLLGLLYLSLHSLAWMSFWGGLGLLMTFVTLFLAATAFLSKAIVAYLAGELILSRIAPSTLRYPIVPLILGLLLYVLLASIPYVGFFIGLVVTLLGLGSIWLTRKQALTPADASVEFASA